MREAEAAAVEIRREAQESARRHVEQLRGEQRRIEEEIGAMDRVHRTYLAQLRLLAERQLAELSVAEERTLPPVGRRPALEAGRDGSRHEEPRQEPTSREPASRADVHPLDARDLEAVAAELESAFGAVSQRQSEAEIAPREQAFDVEPVFEPTIEPTFASGLAPEVETPRESRAPSQPWAMPRAVAEQDAARDVDRSDAASREDGSA